MEKRGGEGKVAELGQNGKGNIVVMSRYIVVSSRQILRGGGKRGRWEKKEGLFPCERE